MSVSAQELRVYTFKILTHMQISIVSSYIFITRHIKVTRTAMYYTHHILAWYLVLEWRILHCLTSKWLSKCMRLINLSLFSSDFNLEPENVIMLSYSLCIYISTQMIFSNISFGNVAQFTIESLTGTYLVMRALIVPYIYFLTRLISLTYSAL